MEEENSRGSARSKEEEDRAWWSDYQASTKLHRKWVKVEESDEDFDDILGDLDDIVNNTEVGGTVQIKDAGKLAQISNVKCYHKACIQLK